MTVNRCSSLCVRSEPELKKEQKGDEHLPNFRRRKKQDNYYYYYFIIIIIWLIKDFDKKKIKIKKRYIRFKDEIFVYLDVAEVQKDQFNENNLMLWV